MVFRSSVPAQRSQKVSLGGFTRFIEPGKYVHVTESAMDALPQGASTLQDLSERRFALLLRVLAQLTAKAAASFIGTAP